MTKEINVTEVKKKVNRLRGIYSITHIPSGRVYIGSSISIIDRLKTHIGSLFKNKHRNPRLQHTFNRDGIQSFSFSIIRLVDDNFSRDMLYDLEDTYISHYVANNLAFNIASARGGTTYQNTQEREITSKNISEACKNIMLL